MPPSFSFFPSSIDIRGVESLYVQLLQNYRSSGWWSQKKNFLRPTGGGCHHTDLRIAAGAKRDKENLISTNQEGGL
ncbi:hypothetical protein PAMP_005979 [Pampus punctatissimus]